jgi:hypothetical protein
MTEIKSVLERVRDQLMPSPDAFGRFASYRRRKRLRQRLAAGGLALALAAVGTTIAVRAFSASHGSPTTVPTPTPTPTSTPTLTPVPEPSPHEVTTFKVGPTAQTEAILAADGSIWVTAYGVPGGGGVDRDVLFRIDPATNEVVAKIAINTAPTWVGGGGGVTFADGSIWVTGGGRVAGEGPQALLDRIDPATNEVVTTIPLGGRYGGDVAANTEGIWVAISGDQNTDVIQVDPATNEVVSRIPLPSTQVRRIAATDDAVLVEEHVWEGNQGPCGVLTSIDPNTAVIVAREPSGDPCQTVNPAAGNPLVWDGAIWGLTSDRFVPIDPKTALPAGNGFAFEPDHSPRSFLVADETGIWYGAYPGGNGVRPDRLARMDPTTGDITDYMQLTNGSIAASIIDGSLWTLNYDGTVTRIDLFAKESAPPSPE